MSDKYADLRESLDNGLGAINTAEARLLLADLDTAEAERDWLASDEYIAACPPNAPLHKPLVWSADGMTVEDGGCGGDVDRCVRCRLAAAREAVRHE